MPFTYDYPRPMVTVDAFLVRMRRNRLELLLIQRKKPPFQNRWALPGGYVGIDEPVEDAACRELAEETGVSDIPLIQTGLAADPHRDPRGRTLSVVFTGIVPCRHRLRLQGGDDARTARWFPLERLPPLAFDHHQLVQRQLATLRFFALSRMWILEFFRPQPLTIENLQRLQQILSLHAWPPPAWDHLLSQLPFLEAKARTYCWKVAHSMFTYPDEFWVTFWGKYLVPPSQSFG